VYETGSSLQENYVETRVVLMDEAKPGLDILRLGCFHLLLFHLAAERPGQQIRSSNHPGLSFLYWVKNYVFCCIATYFNA
jgi:hypothetical protein